MPAALRSSDGVSRHRVRGPAADVVTIIVLLPDVRRLGMG
jgi:hypothetical protein